jgi:hypothetical protein
VGDLRKVIIMSSFDSNNHIASSSSKRKEVYFYLDSQEVNKAHVKSEKEVVNVADEVVAFIYLPIAPEVMSVGLNARGKLCSLIV